MQNLGQHTHMKLVKACIVGGNWNNSSNAGVGCVNLNNTRSNSNNNIGGRDSISKLETTKVDTRNTGICCPANSEINNETKFSSRLILESQTVSKKSKRIGFLFEKAFTKKALYEAYLVARKDKRRKKVLIFLIHI